MFTLITMLATASTSSNEGSRHRQHGADGGLGDAQHTRALAQAQASFEVGAKGLSYLTHGDPGCAPAASAVPP